MSKRLGKYLAWTFGITYLCWGGLAVLVQLGVLTFAHPAAVALHFLGGFGPPIAVVIMCWDRCKGKAGLRWVFRWEKGTLWYALVFFILEIGVVALSSREVNPLLPWGSVPLVFLQAVFLYGGNEELGWRGFMQPALEEKLPFPLAAMITGAVWAVWHVPLWFVDGASQQGIPFFLFAALAILQSFWYGAVYKRTKCVFCCSVLHGLTNTLLSLFVIKVNALLIFGFLVMLGLAILVWYLPAGREK